MTISTLLMILALAVGSGTSQPVESDSALCPIGVPTCRIGNNCYVNGVLVNPCPDDAPPADPAPLPETQPPT